MDLSFKTQISDDDDDKSDASIVTDTTVNTLDGRSPILFPILQKYTTEKEDDLHVFTGTVCSPIIPVLSASFFTKSLKQASQSSVEEDYEDSNESYVSESLISMMPQKTKQEGKQNHPARLFHVEHKEQTRGIIKEEKRQMVTREVIHNQNNELIGDRHMMHSSQPSSTTFSNLDVSLRSNGSVGGNNPVIPDSVTESQETYLPDIESEIECAKMGELKEKTKERRKQDKLFSKHNSECHNEIMSYEMVAVTNSFLNNEKLSMLDENNVTNKQTPNVEDLQFESCISAKDSNHSSKRLSAQNNANLLETDVHHLSEQMTCLAAPIQANCESISSPQKLLHIAASKSENLPQLSEKDIKCICMENTMPNIINKRNKTDKSQEVTQLCVDDTRETTQLHMDGTREVTQDNQVHVQNEGWRTTFSSQNAMETTLNSSADKLFERAIQNEDGVLRSSKETIPSTEVFLTQPIVTKSPKQSATNNCKNYNKYPDTFDGSQNLFPDTQSSLGSITKSTELSSINLQNIDMKCSNQETAKSLLDDKFNTNQTPTIQSSTDSIPVCLSTVAGQHQMLDVEMTQQTQENPLLSGSQENPLLSGSQENTLSGSQELNVVTGQNTRQEHHHTQISIADNTVIQQQEVAPSWQSSATQYDGIVTLEDAAYQSKASSAKNVNDDMDISSDVEPSQMILMTAQAMISEERTRSDCLTSSQSLSSSSLSSLGDISEGGVNYKNKEKHILYKVEKMQGKIQKKLLAASEKSSVLDVDITKQKLQAIKGILIKIAERHKVERNKLSLDVKKSSKSRASKTQIRENLIELSERQKLLYKLFQNHKEISRIIREDLNKSLASALKLDDEGTNEKQVRQQRSENNKTGGMKVKKLNRKKSEKGNNEGFKSKTLKSRSLPAVSKEEHTSNAKVVTVTKQVPNISHSVSKVVASNLMEVVADDRRHAEEVIVTSSTNGIDLRENNSAVQRNTRGQENDKNYCISLNGTQELYCDKEEEMTTDNCTDVSQQKTQIECSTSNPGGEITTVGQSSSLMTQTPGFLGSNCSAESDEHMLKAMGLFTSTQTVPRPVKSKGHGCWLKQVDNDKFITVQQKMKVNEGITPQFSEGIYMPISSISTSKVHRSSQFDPKISTEELRPPIIDLTGQSTICISGRDSVPVQKGRVLPSSAPIVLPRPSISASKSLTHSSVPVLIQNRNATYLSVSTSTTNSVMVGNSEQTGSNVTAQDRGTILAHPQGNTTGNAKVVPTGICMPNNNITVIRVPDYQTNGKLTSSQDKQKRQTCSQPKNKPVHGSQKTSSSRNKTTPDDEKCMHSQNEVMKKVMEDAMRIINERTIGNLKRPLTGIENGWQAKQSRLYTADPEMPMNRDIFKSPPLHQVEAARNISPSATSFATFRSTFPEHSPDICTQSQYLTEDPSPVGIFYGLKYPPLDMLIEKQILRPGENVLSVSARDKEFKASLTTEGCIESIGGELFQTPVKWLAAILGKPVPDVKKNRAYKEVYCRGKPLIAYVEDPTLVPDEYEATPDIKAGQHESNGKVDQSRQDSMKKLKNMLNNCTIRLLDDTNLVSDSDLPENFWTEDFSKVKLSIDMWKDVDKWD